MIHQRNEITSAPKFGYPTPLESFHERLEKETTKSMHEAISKLEWHEVPLGPTKIRAFDDMRLIVVITILRQFFGH